MRTRSLDRRVKTLALALGGVAGVLLSLLASSNASARDDPEQKPPSLSEAWVDALEWRSIGPANMGGRITALAVYEADPCIWWVATASGGLLKTTNNGTTFEHQFDREATVSIGDVAVAQSDPNIVWVGTGEANPRNSVSWGNGVYKSTDGGATWAHMGLEKTFQIGRIAIDPSDPDTVYVGALGRLWGPNEERGLYKTTDGGATWSKVLSIDENTGVIDVRMSPADPYTLLAATYQRRRDGFDTNDPAVKWGPGSGIHKTTDGGATWTKITNGLPTGELGRIGLDWYRANPDVVYAVIESDRIGKEPENAPYMGIRGEDAEVGARLTEITEDGPAEVADLRVGDIVIAVEGETVHSYDELIKAIRRHVAGETVRMEVSRERQSVLADVTFTKRPGAEEDEETEAEAERPRRRPRQRSPFASGLGGQRENAQDQQGPDGHEFGGVYRSSDAGDTWTRINSVNPRPMYFSQIRVDPSDESYLYVLGISLYRSKDGGAEFAADGGRGGVHVDHHALWIDPNDGRHMILGNDGGLYVTHDRMEHWDHLNHMAIGQFYHVTVGPRRNYMVYGGLQDNGSWGGPGRSRNGSGPINEDWLSIGGGDGFICFVDPDDPDQVFFASQNGGLGRRNLRTGERGFIRPRAPRGTRYRWNWKTPYILSHHNARIYYCAANYVFRSLARGDGIKRISPEITNTDKGSATALDESPLDSDVLYVGTDDGALWATRNGGHEWYSLFGEIPQEQAGPRDEATRAPPIDGAARPEAGPPRRGGRFGGRGGPGGPGGGGDRAGRMRQMLQRLDANGDGQIERDEVPGRMVRMFDRLDRNTDGIIDAKEIQSASAARRRGEGRGGPPPESPEPPPEQDAPTRATEPGTTDTPPPAEPPTEPAEPAAPPAAAPEAEESPATERPTEEPAAQPATNDPVTGTWKGRAISDEIPSEQGGFTFVLKLAPDGKVTGTFTSQFNEGQIAESRYDADTGRIHITFDSEEMQTTIEFAAKITGSTMTGDADVGSGMFSFQFEAQRTSTAAPESGVGQETAPQPDDGYDWKPLGELVPEPRWVSSIEASRFEAGRVYLALDGHRSDDDEPHIFVSEDYGRRWRSLRANLPTSAGSTRCLREDVKNPDMLYLGTEFGMWISIDRGTSWTCLSGAGEGRLPTVAVHEIAIHPTAGEIVAGTHGRSLWALDVTPLRQMNAATTNSAAHLYKPNDTIYWRSQPRRGGDLRRFVGTNPSPGANLFYSLATSPQEISLSITDPAGKTIRELDVEAEPGLHRATWDLRRPAPQRRGGQARGPQGRRPPGGRGGRFRRGRLVPAGTYTVVLEVDGQRFEQDLLVQTDPEYPDYHPWETEEEELRFEEMFEEEEESSAEDRDDSIVW